MSARSAALPDAAREQSWRLLWQRLLQPIPNDADPEPEEHQDDDEAA